MYVLFFLSEIPILYFGIVVLYHSICFCVKHFNLAAANFGGFYESETKKQKKTQKKQKQKKKKNKTKKKKQQQ